MNNLEIKKAARLILWSFAAFVGFIAVYYGVINILKLFNLRFRIWVAAPVKIIAILFLLLTVIAIVHTLCLIYKVPQSNISIRLRRQFLSVAGIVVIVAFFGFVSLATLGVSAFSHKPEHVVEKHGQTMVAQVTSWLDVVVDYYEHKNFIVCGYKRVGYEWYGSGGYDPLVSMRVLEPLTYWFTDFDGNLIAGER